MKICTRCKQPKELADFNFKIKSKNIYSPHCKACSRAYIKNHYQKNRQYYLNKAKIRNKAIREEIRNLVWNYLNNHSCIDCGEKNPIVLEFDHIAIKHLPYQDMVEIRKLKQ